MFVSENDLLVKTLSRGLGVDLKVKSEMDMIMWAQDSQRSWELVALYDWKCLKTIKEGGKIAPIWCVDSRRKILFHTAIQTENNSGLTILKPIQAVLLSLDGLLFDLEGKSAIFKSAVRHLSTYRWDCISGRW